MQRAKDRPTDYLAARAAAADPAWEGGTVEVSDLRGESMGPDHEAEVEISCPSCWEEITTSVHHARRDLTIRCPSCGTIVSLGTKTVQDAADEAERAWLAEQEAKGGPSP